MKDLHQYYFTTNCRGKEHPTVKGKNIEVLNVKKMSNEFEYEMKHF